VFGRLVGQVDHALVGEPESAIFMFEVVCRLLLAGEVLGRFDLEADSR
jgi:hypothetical protein